jgi:diadenosine tetraphosphate (Ap4A) HIT family hydrolase
MTPFRLDERLKNDSLEIGALDLCQLRLMNDCRWSWLVLAPMRAGAVEIHGLAGGDQITLAQETALAASILKQLTGCEKINSAALGNIVRQLHVHVVARSAGDPNWPGPVWGFGQRVPYSPEALALVTERLRTAFFPHFS